MTNLCPYCNHDFGKPIKQKRVCPACKNTMVIRGGLPVTQDDAEGIDNKLEIKRTAKHTVEIQQRKRDFRAYLVRDLKQYKEMGVKSVILTTNCPTACPVCKAMEGTVYTLDEAIANHPIPVKGCKDDVCRCGLRVHEYLPMAERISMERERKSTSTARSKKTKASSNTGCLLSLITGLIIIFWLATIQF